MVPVEETGGSTNYQIREGENYFSNERPGKKRLSSTKKITLTQDFSIGPVDCKTLLPMQEVQDQSLIRGN